jgi:transcription elongation factor Elf1
MTKFALPSRLQIFSLGMTRLMTGNRRYDYISDSFRCPSCNECANSECTLQLTQIILSCLNLELRDTSTHQLLKS